METFDLKEYVKKNVDTFDWYIKKEVRIDDHILGGNHYYLYHDIEGSRIIYDFETRDLYIGEYLDQIGGISTTYETRLGWLFDRSFINKLKKYRRDLLLKEKIKDDADRLKKLPKSILRDYKIDEILDEE